jgi:hypothetical protein
MLQRKNRAISLQNQAFCTLNVTAGADDGYRNGRAELWQVVEQERIFCKA